MLDFICMLERTFFIPMPAGDFVTSWKFMQCPQCLGAKRKKESEIQYWFAFRNMKLFLLFKYQTEIEIDSPSGGQRTDLRKREREKKYSPINFFIEAKNRESCKKMQNKFSFDIRKWFFFQKQFQICCKFESRIVMKNRRRIWNQFHIPLLPS